MLDDIKELIKLPPGKLVIALLLIAIVALWLERSSAKGESEKDILRHDRIIAIRDSIIRSEKIECDAKLAFKDAEIKQATDKHSALLEQLLKQSMEANRGVKKAEKDVDKAIKQSKSW